MDFILDFLKSILFGIVQGITEWLPISSTGHLILLDSLMPLDPPEFFEVFKVVIQFGSIIAVVVLPIVFSLYSGGSVQIHMV